jgi:DNA gyrase inhibitor GyrI
MNEDWDVDVDNDLRSERENQKQQLAQFKSWLQAEGVLPRETKAST